MKLIDLLNKMANNEEVPKKVKINNEPFDYDEKLKMYYTLEKDEYFGLFPLLFYNLNDEVEILEEKKIPEKIDHLIGYDIRQFDDLKEYVEITTNDLFGKINKVIDTLNEIIDYLKSKEE